MPSACQEEGSYEEVDEEDPYADDFVEAPQKKMIRGAGSTAGRRRRF